MHKEYICHKQNAETAVLFIHGFLGSPRHFDKFVEKCGDNVSVYNVLLNGHGGSAKDFSNASMNEWKKQISDISEMLCQRYEKIVIAAHSMGTFFAVEEAIKHPDKVKGLLLLQPALCIRLMPRAVINSLKAVFGRVSRDDEVAVAYETAHSVTLTKKLWQYIGWIPRYIELFAESVRMRKVIRNLDTPCFVFPSKNDELVSLRTVKYIPENRKIKITVLPNSAHFIYDAEDEKLFIQAFENLI